MNLSIIILIMDQLNSALIKLRDRFLNSCSDFVEPGYYILSHKTNPLSQEEAQFKEIYANTFAIHCLSIAFSVPGAVYYYHYFKAARKSPVDEKRLTWARRRMLVFVPLALSLSFTGYLYESTNHFRDRMKAIEQFYLNHKGEDLNAISFEPYTYAPK